MTATSAIDLGAYDTDKSREYLDNYEREFGHLFSQRVVLLELGVQRGGSLLLWRDLFPKGTIAGLDLNPVHVPDETARIHVYTGYQQDPAILDRIAAEVAPDGFDLIVDDASHIGEYTSASFWHLFSRYLKPGGVYVIDDWSCGYWPKWADGHRYSGSRAALGQGKTIVGASDLSRLETIRRRVRRSARPLAARLSHHPRLKNWLQDVYMKAEGHTLQRRLPSHDYGMVGFVKQLIDACAVDVIDSSLGGGASVVEIGQIRSVHINSSQVFVHKKYDMLPPQVTP